MELSDRLRSLSRLSWASLGVIAVALIAMADKETGDEFGFYVLYLFPIALTSWYAGSEAGLAISTFSAFAWVSTEPTHQNSLVLFWEMTMRLITFIVVSISLARLRIALDHERLLSRTDPLTGATNRRSFYELLERESRRAHRQGSPLSLAYIDLDNFKAVNDQFGHGAGDEVLRTVADAIAPNIRVADTLCRLGGDEFAILFPETDAPAVEAAIRKVQRVLAEAMEKGGWPVTFSIGLPTFQHPPLSAFDMIRKADELMYAAKKAGRNGLRLETVPH